MPWCHVGEYQKIPPTGYPSWPGTEARPPQVLAAQGALGCSRFPGSSRLKRRRNAQNGRKPQRDIPALLTHQKHSGEVSWGSCKRRVGCFWRLRGKTPRIRLFPPPIQRQKAPQNRFPCEIRPILTCILLRDVRRALLTVARSKFPPAAPKGRAFRARLPADLSQNYPYSGIWWGRGFRGPAAPERASPVTTRISATAKVDIKCVIGSCCVDGYHTCRHSKSRGNPDG